MVVMGVVDGGWWVMSGDVIYNDCLYDEKWERVGEHNSQTASQCT